MELVIPIISDRDYEWKPKEVGKGGLEAHPFANGIWFSACPCTPAGIISPKGEGEWV